MWIVWMQDMCVDFRGLGKHTFILLKLGVFITSISCMLDPKVGKQTERNVFSLPKNVWNMAKCDFLHGYSP